MNLLSKWIRMAHRWLVIPFVLAAIVTMFSSSSDSSVQSPPGMSVVLLVSLLALLGTGLYMFAQHYLRKLRAR
jgi:hypothetical protein